MLTKSKNNSGQHRILGFARTDEQILKNHFMPVVLIQKLAIAKEISTFIEINQEQKRIDKNLIYMLIADALWDVNINPNEYYIRQTVEIIKQLKEKSPIKKYIYIPDALENTTKNKIKLVTFVKALISNNFSGKNPIHKKNEYKNLNDIFINIKKLFSETNWNYLLNSKGFRILMKVISICEKNIIKNIVNVNRQDYIKDLNLVLNTSHIQKIFSGGFGEGGATQVAYEILLELKRTKNYAKLEIKKQKLRMVIK